MNHLGPVLGAVLFLLLMSRVKEPARQQVNALLVCGASAAYLSGGGFGVWELPFVVAGTSVAYLGLKSYRFIGIGWLMHTLWDLVHHHYGNPIWPFMPSSSHGCAIFDAVLGVWFLTRVRASSRAQAQP